MRILTLGTKVLRYESSMNRMG